MKEDWSALRELLLPPVSEGGQRGRRLERALREAMRDGRLPAGTRLPGTRDLGAQLGLARGTVAAAYTQLRAEGYLTARPGSGTRVADSVAAPVPAAEPDPSPPEWRFRLTPGLPSLAEFPRRAWLRAVATAAERLPDAALGYPDAAGLPQLRVELAAYLGRVRALAAGAEDLVVTHGTFDALGMVAGSLVAAGHRSIAIEDPSGTDQAELLRDRGLGTVPVPVDGHGLRVDDLARTGCRAVIVTPAHQYPTGVALSAERRRELIAWARERDGLIVEDDYDAEYRYDRPAAAALQNMDPGRVVYVGSVSKTLAPAVRLGWLAAPAALRPDLVRRKWLASRGCGVFEQSGFAELLRGGGYDRHLRRTRLVYRRRRDALVEAVARHLPEAALQGLDAGLHLLLVLPEGGDDAAVARAAARSQIRVSPLSDYLHAREAPPALVLGFAGLTPARIDAAIASLAESVAQAA